MRFSGFSGFSGFSRFSGFARVAAVAIAVAAIVDPVLSLPRTERPPIRVLATDGQELAPLSAALRKAGFTVNAAEREAATVVVGNRPPRPPSPAAADRASERQAAVWAFDTTPRAPNVRIEHATVPAVRLPEHAVEVSVTAAAEGMTGQTTEIVLEDAGIAVASRRHMWGRNQERARVRLQYLPPAASSVRLRVNAVPLAAETSTSDNVMDVAAPGPRGPVRLLVVEAGVTWPAVFVRRALEGEAAFAVSAVQRASKNVVTRAGAPPAALTRGALAPFEVALVGGPDNLTGSDLDALRWFVEVRGGVVVFVPDQRPGGRYVDLSGVSSFESRAVETALKLTSPGGNEGELSAAELLIPRSLPAGATVLAADPAGAPVVFASRRGAGAVIVSGALDAWRHRADDGFARFWRRTIAGHAAAVPPALDVTADPALVRPGEATTITARIRTSELPEVDRIDLDPVSARAIDPAAKIDVSVRLWPTAEPGVYVGEWRPAAPGVFNVSVIAGSLRGDAVVTADSGTSSGSSADPEGLALVTRASGGRVFPSDQPDALAEAMATAYPARTVRRPVHLMRSTWWVVAFAGLLCGEWAIRRKRGLP
jgi:hypothetical protein